MIEGVKQALDIAAKRGAFNIEESGQIFNILNKLKSDIDRMENIIKSSQEAVKKSEPVNDVEPVDGQKPIVKKVPAERLSTSKKRAGIQ